MRRNLAALGVGLVLLGAAVVAVPDIGATFSGVVTPTVLALLGLVVALVGAAVTVGPVRPDNAGGGRSRTLDDDLLGADFDGTLARVETMSAVELRTSDAPAALRGRLREAVVALVASRAGVDRETAAARVERGEWTDDPVAAAYLSGSLRAPAAVRWRERLSTTPRAAARARRTVEALEGKS